jgi:carboxylesterase type B
MIANNGQQVLFSRAILLSGAPFLGFGKVSSKQPFFDRLAQGLNCSSPVTNKLECLRELPTDAFPLDGSFEPVLDEYISRDTILAYSSNMFSKIPLLVNTNRDEGDIFFLGSSIPPFRQTITNLFRRKLQERDVLEIEARYAGMTPAAQSSALLGDVVFQCPSVVISESYSRNKLPIYKTFFEHKPLKPFVQLDSVYHGAELPFIFHFDLLLDSSEDLLSRNIQRALVQFTKAEEPTVMGLKLPTYDSREVTVINNSGTAKIDPKLDVCSFILRIYENSIESIRRIKSIDSFQ